MKLPRRYIFWALGVCVALGAAAFGGWWYWNRYCSPQITPSEQEYPLRGIDLSAHNGEIDFSRLQPDKVDFAYIKATEGTDFADRQFLDNYRGLRKLGIPVGAYHFFRFDTDGEMQALNFMAALRYRQFDLSPAVDIEEWGNPDGQATARIVERLRDMLTLMEAYGHHPVLYTNRDGYQRFIRGNFDSYPLWLCSFSDPPLPQSFGTHPAVWQYSHRGSIDGISGPVDLDAAAMLP